MLKDEVSKQAKAALKAGDSLRVSTLRLLYNALHNEEINKQRELSDDEETAVVKRQLKQREEAIGAYKKAGREESAEKERHEAEILKAFLPEQMSELEVRELVDRVIKEAENRDFGTVMKLVMEEVKGRADGKVVSGIVRAKLSN